MQVWDRLVLKINNQGSGIAYICQDADVGRIETMPLTWMIDGNCLAQFCGAIFSCKRKKKGLCGSHHGLEAAPIGIKLARLFSTPIDLVENAMSEEASRLTTTVTNRISASHAPLPVPRILLAGELGPVGRA